jgi:hypothetical protein
MERRRMINKGDYSQKRAGLKADMIGKANRVIGTVEKVEEVEVPDNRTNEPRKALAITFAEFRDNPYWPNGTSIGILCDVLGNDETKWVGKKIPLEKVRTNNPTTGQKMDGLWVMDKDEWPAEATPKNGKPVVAAGGKKK